MRLIENLPDGRPFRQLTVGSTFSKSTDQKSHVYMVVEQIKDESGNRINAVDLLLGELVHFNMEDIVYHVSCKTYVTRIGLYY